MKKASDTSGMAAFRDEMLDRLREKFRTGSEEFGRRYFDLNALESRIASFRAIGGNLDSFLLAEMELYNRARQIALQKAQDEAARAEVNARMEAIMAANAERLYKYPEKYTAAGASFELRRLIGAIHELYPEAVRDLEFLCKGTPEWLLARNILSELGRYQNGSPEDPVFRYYSENVLKRGEAYREVLERQIMQSVSGSLQGITELIHLILESDQKFLNRLTRESSGTIKSGVQVATELTEKASAILADFRLEDWASAAWEQMKKGF